MRVDTNTLGHHQWFYFNIKYSSLSLKDKPIKFKICNFTKPASLYNYGMRICMAKQSKDFNWHKGGENIEYGKGNVIRRPSTDPLLVRYYYNLSFEITLDAEEDKIYFAYCFNYTFSKQLNFLKNLQNECKTKNCLKQTSLCKDLSGIKVPLLTITSRLQSDPKQLNQIKMQEFTSKNDLISLPLYKKKKFCIVGSRVHPGETPSSWMMQGFLKCLTGNSH